MTTTNSKPNPAPASKAQTVTQIVNSEAELNAAIAAINGGTAPSSIIDVQSSFTLTGDVTGVKQNMTLTSSNESSIDDGGFSVLSISNGAIVGVALDAGGTGTVTIHGDEMNTTLEGLDGGAVANIFISKDGKLLVADGDIFRTGGVEITPISGATICGTLSNSQSINLYEGIISNSNCTSAMARVGDVNLIWESFLDIAPQTLFQVGNVTVQTICSVNSDGTGTIIPSGNFIVSGDPQTMHLPGTVSGVNVDGEITLENGGIYTCSSDNPFTPGGSATTVTNTSGVFDLGVTGTWNVETYLQTGGLLRISLPDFRGDAPLLSVGETATFSGGSIHIDATIYYLPPGTEGAEIKIISAKQLVIADLAGMIQFNYFPTGITPTAKQIDNDLYLYLSVGA